MMISFPADRFAVVVRVAVQVPPLVRGGADLHRWRCRGSLMGRCSLSLRKSLRSDFDYRCGVAEYRTHRNCRTAQDLEYPQPSALPCEARNESLFFANGPRTLHEVQDVCTRGFSEYSLGAFLCGGYPGCRPFCPIEFPPDKKPRRSKRLRSVAVTWYSTIKSDRADRVMVRSVAACPRRISRPCLRRFASYALSSSHRSIRF